jgi:hypothetical protein
MTAAENDKLKRVIGSTTAWVDYRWQGRTSESIDVSQANGKTTYVLGSGPGCIGERGNNKVLINRFWGGGTAMPDFVAASALWPEQVKQDAGHRSVAPNRDLTPHTAVRFDEVDGALSVPLDASFDPRRYSIAGWFNWRDYGTDKVQFLFARSLENMELHTGGGAGTNGLRFIPAGYPESHVDAPGVIESGWNHVVVTYDGLTSAVYVNGVLVASAVRPGEHHDLRSDTSRFFVGQRQDSGPTRFKGSMSDVTVYNDVLTLGEIGALARPGGHRGLVGAYPLTASAKRPDGKLQDISGGIHDATTVKSPTHTANRDGVADAAIHLEDDSHIVIPHHAGLATNSFTIAAWINSPFGADFIFSKGLEHMELHTLPNNGLRFIPAGYPQTVLDAPSVLQSGWNHVALTYDGASAAIWVGGVKVASRSDITSRHDLLTDRSPLHVGVRISDVQANRQTGMAGDISDVKIYDRVLSGAEIEGIRGPGHNLALTGTAAQVDDFGTFVAKNAIDGVTSTFSHTKSRDQPWWEVDLGSVRTIEQIRIHPREDCCQDQLDDFHAVVTTTSRKDREPDSINALRESPDVVWVSDAQATVERGAPRVIDVGGARGRYLLILIDGAGKYLHMGEVEVIGH